jgi:hypothetical protein
MDIEVRQGWIDVYKKGSYRMGPVREKSLTTVFQGLQEGIFLNPPMIRKNELIPPIRAIEFRSANDDMHGKAIS